MQQSTFPESGNPQSFGSAMISATVVIEAISSLFSEAYEGPQNNAPAWFSESDSQTGAGLLGMLALLSAGEASTTLTGDSGQGSTIAAHVEHLRWSLALSNALSRGEQVEADWEESWCVRTVDSAGWERLRQALGGEYRTLRQVIQSQNDLPAEYVTTGIAIVAHAAYHLGAIRQMVRLLKG